MIDAVPSLKELDIWKDDLLFREEDAKFLQTFLLRRLEEREKQTKSHSYVLNLDARWGFGKTFFLTRFQKQLAAAGHMAVYVNAWQDDHADDPLVPVMSALDKALRPMLSSKGKLERAWKITKESGLQIAATAALSGVKKAGSKVLGAGASNIAEIIGDSGFDEVGEVLSSGAESADKGIEKFIDAYAKSLLAKFEKAKKSINRFRGSLASFVAQMGAIDGVKKRLFVLIDEVDRCRPTYAILLLERIKHLFDVNGVVFIIATDTEQLGHTIRSVYGQSFDGPRYLLRFFDRTYAFSDPKLEAFVTALFTNISSSPLSSPPDNQHERFFADAMRYFCLSLRDAEQCFDHLRTVCTTWPYKVPLELIYLLPLIVAFQQGNARQFAALENMSVAGEDELRSSPAAEWKIEFVESGKAFAQPGATKKVDFFRLFTLFINMAKRPLHKIMEEDYESAENRWARDRFQNELNIVHNGRVSRIPESIILEYPSMVQRAGRLTAAG